MVDKILSPLQVKKDIASGKKEVKEFRETKIQKIAKQIGKNAYKNVGKTIDKYEKEKIVSKKILKTSKATLTIKEKKPAEYVPIYFTAEIKKEKDNFFFN
jgi:hypothetical protein